MKVIISLLALVAAASAGLLAPTVISRAPAFDSAVIKSDRLGGNFAYSVAESHAYAAHTPIIQHVAQPVAVSYSAPAVVASAPAVVAPAPVVVAHSPAVVAPAPVVVARASAVIAAAPAVVSAAPAYTAYSAPAVVAAAPAYTAYSVPAYATAYSGAYGIPTAYGAINGFGAYGYGLGVPTLLKK